MLDAAAGFPRRSDDTLKTVAIGGVCLLFGFLVFPALFVQGYIMRVLREGGGDARPPSFDDWEELLVDGVKAYAVQFVYSFVPMVLFFAFFAIVGASVLALGASGSASAAGGALFMIAVLVGIVVMAVVGLGAFYLVPAALALVARTERVGAAFDFGTLKQVTFTSEYFVGFLLYLVVLFVGTMVGALLVIVFFLGIFVIFYTQVAGYYVIATTVDDVLAEASA